jgi:uncharacterized protein
VKQSMDLRVLRQSDHPEFAAFLDERIESSLFLRSNALIAGLEDHGERYQGTVVGAYNEGTLIGLGGHYWNGNLILQAPTCTAEIVRHLAAIAKRPFAGALGPLDQVKTALTELEVPPDQLSAELQEVLYRLSLEDLIIPEHLSAPQLTARPTASSDLPTLVDWRLSYELETMNLEETEASREQAEKDERSKVEGGAAWVLTRDGELVSRTGLNAQLPGIVQIGGVWTPPSERCQGFARLCVARHLEALRESGMQTAILFADEGNVAARRAYEALGFYSIGDYAIFLWQNQP